MATIKNPNHEKFIQEYLKCGVSVRAYQIVYPNASYETAKVNACRLTRKYKAEIHRRFEASRSAEKIEPKRTVIHVTIGKHEG